MNKMIEIKWGGRGKRILGPAEGYSQTYTCDGHGAVVAVPQKDALRVLTEPRAQFTCVNPADLALLEVEGVAFGEIRFYAGGLTIRKKTGDGGEANVPDAPNVEPEMDREAEPEPEPATPKPPARKGRKPSGTGTKPKKADA